MKNDIAENGAQPEPKALTGEDSVQELVSDSSESNKAWNAFAAWWGPRHDGQPPRKEDPTASEAYQYYCAGTLDEREKWSLPHNVMQTCLRKIQAELDEAGKVLESHIANAEVSDGSGL